MYFPTVIRHSVSRCPVAIGAERTHATSASRIPGDSGISILELITELHNSQELSLCRVRQLSLPDHPQ
jgi:hypothetical protein